LSSRRLAGAGVAGLLGAAITALFGWGRAKGLAVALGPAGVGAYGQLWAFVLYAGSFGALGIGVGTTALIAGSRERNETAPLADIYGTSLLIPAIAAATLALIVAGSATFSSELILRRHEPWLVVLAAASIPFVALQLPLQHVIQGFEDVKGQTVIYAIYGAVFTIAAVAGAYTYGVTGAAIGLAIGNVALAGLYLVRAARLMANVGIGPFGSANRDWVAPLLRVGVASLCVTVVYGLADLAVRTTLLHTHGARVAGFWFAVSTLSLQLIGTLSGAIGYFTAPLAARAGARSDTIAVRALLDDSVRLTMLVLVPVLALLLALRSWIVPLLFSSQFTPVSHAMPLEVTGDFLRGIGWALGVALVPLAMTRWWLGVGVSTSLVFAVVGSLFAANWGLNGAAGAWCVTWFVALAITARALSTRGMLRPSRHTAAVLCLGAVALAITAALPGMPGAFAAGLTVVGLVRFGTRPTERASAMRQLRRWFST
jgi:polysaccharide transporter, PST family